MRPNPLIATLVPTVDSFTQKRYGGRIPWASTLQTRARVRSTVSQCEERENESEPPHPLSTLTPSKIQEPNGLARHQIPMTQQMTQVQIDHFSLHRGAIEATAELSILAKFDVHLAGSSLSADPALLPIKL